MMIFKLFAFLVPVLLVSLTLASVLTPFLPYPFFRVFSRCLYGFGILAILFFQKRFRHKTLSDFGLHKDRHVGSDLLLGIGLSTFFFMIVTLLCLGTDYGVFRLEIPLPRKLMNYVLGSIFIAFFEEIVFRGVLFQTLLDDCSKVVSAVVSSVIYSLVHFIRPLLTQPEDLAFFPTEATGLFLFGLLLCYAYLRTHSLYLSMGIHGAFVLLLKVDGLFINRLMRPPVWIFGEERLVGGIVTWLGILFIFPCIKFFTRNRPHAFTPSKS